MHARLLATLLCLSPAAAVAQTTPAPMQHMPLSAQPIAAQSAPVAIQPAPPSAAPTAMAMHGSPLTQVLDSVRQSYNRQERPMVVFDVDGTLLDNRTRILQILKEYAEHELKAVRPQFAQTILAMTVPQIQYMLPDTLKNAGVTEEAVINNAAIFWSQKFFSDDYLKYDVPSPGIVKFVRDLYSSGARIVYLTARDAPRQLIGTVKSLRDAGFPIGIQGSELIMRPTVQTQDAIFKQQVTNYLRLTGKVIATFDNEPANANVFRRAFSEATVVVFDAPRAPNPPPLLPNIMSISSFE